jgi:GTP-binding protein EngB required for normal cell division
MKLTPYKKILKYSKEKIQESLAPMRANQAKIQGHLEIAKLDEEIVTLEAKITEICAEHPLNFSKIIDAQDKLALIERRKKQLQKIITELFETEEE